MIPEVTAERLKHQFNRLWLIFLSYVFLKTTTKLSYNSNSITIFSHGKYTLIVLLSCGRVCPSGSVCQGRKWQRHWGWLSQLLFSELSPLQSVLQARPPLHSTKTVGYSLNHQSKYYGIIIWLLTNLTECFKDVTLFSAINFKNFHSRNYTTV